MNIAKANEIIDGVMEEIMHGMVVNASGERGEALRKQLRGSFDLLIELDAAARAVAAEKFPKVTSP